MGDLFSSDNMGFMLSGLKTTLIIAVCTTIIGLVLGTILALVRNYCKGKLMILSILATAYIEFFRCTPQILWILIFRFMFKGDALRIGILTFSVVTSPYIAEIVRGGLNNIPKGQIEAGESQGFRFIQILWFIILPQTFKSIIPALFSHITTIVKDTSYLKVVDIYEFMHNSNMVMIKATTISQVFMMYGFVAMTYFVINFTLSRIVRSYSKRVRIA